MTLSSRPTIRQVAKLCGVSAMTVSAVINNKPGQMSAETRERVLKVVRELGYRPTPARWEAQKRQVITLGLVAGVHGDSLQQPGYYSAILHNIIAAADHDSHNITLFTSSLLNMDAHQSIRAYCDDRCDGLLVIAPTVDSQLVKALHERGFPFVLVGDASNYDDVSFIDVDNVAEGYAITEYLLRQGHRRIAYLGGPDFVRSSPLRREGYQSALMAHGIPIEETWICREDTFEATLDHLLHLPPEKRPTALFGWHDNTALEAIARVQALGLKVPEDVSVIGFNDTGESALANSFLTTVRQPYAQIGQRAVELLVEKIRDPNAPPRREFLATELVIRHSVAPPQEA